MVEPLEHLLAGAKKLYGSVDEALWTDAANSAIELGDFCAHIDITVKNCWDRFKLVLNFVVGWINLALRLLENISKQI